MRKITFLLVLSIIFNSCNNKDFYVIEGHTQGTTYKIIYEGEFENLGDEVDSVLHDFDLSLSTYIPNSIISKFNKCDASVFVDKYFIDMYNEALRVYDISDGAFDITIAPIVNAYGFGFTDKQKVVDSLLIDSLLQFVGMGKVSLSRNKLIKKYSQTMIDGNAIAQGQSVDIVCEYLETKGINNYLVDIGGELKAKGKKYGHNWIIGIDKPIEGNMEEGKDIQVKLSVADIAVATSGDYRKFYIEDGKRYGHSINPKTGLPARQNVLSVTIITDKCITADAVATACMVLGFERSKKIIEENPELEAYFIYVDENGKSKVYYTKGVEKYFEGKARGN